jgi:hypothetical protein
MAPGEWGVNTCVRVRLARAAGQTSPATQALGIKLATGML